MLKSRAMRLLLIGASAWLFLYVALALAPDNDFGIFLELGPLMVGGWIAFAISALFVSVQSFRRKEWPSAIISLVLPFAVPIVGYEATPYVRYPADYARFQRVRSSYDADVAKLPNDGKRYAEFNWGGMSFASKGVVYDETDEVALPRGHQTAAWRKRMESTDLTCGSDGPIGPVMHLSGHYYVVSFGC